MSRKALQAAADRLSPEIIRQQLDHWTWVVGPKFSQKDRAAINLSRHYSLQPVEYCLNFVFRRKLPIHKLFEPSCDLGLFRLTADKLTEMFGFRLHKRMRGKLATVLERMEHGHHVLRAWAKNAVLRMDEKFSTFLPLKVLSNNLKDFGLKKSLDNLETVRRTLAVVTDRFAQFEAQALDVHVDFPLFQRLALPIPSGNTKIRVALMFILFHQRICGLLANTLFHRRPTQLHTPATQLQLAYQKADASIQQIIDLLAA
jgi:hypothetical protein